MLGAVVKIGFVFDDTLDAPDGVQQHITMLGREYARRGHEVHYLVGETHEAQRDPAFAFAQIHSMARNVKVKFNSNRMRIPLPASRRAMRELLQRERFDVLHVQAPYSPFMAGRLLAQARRITPLTQIFATYHIAVDSGVAMAGGMVLGRVINARTERLIPAGHSVAVSRVAAEYARRTAGVETRVVPNPVDVARMKAGACGAVPRRHHVVFLGRFVERKGVGVLLDALDWGVRRGVFPADLSVAMAGKGPLLEQCRERAAHIGVPIEFLGEIAEDAKSAFLASGQVAVFPATGAESFGIVLLEAIASGAGVVLAGDNPGYRSTMMDNDDVLVDVTGADRAEHLARAIARACTDDEWAQRVHRWQHDTLLPAYDVTTVADALLAMYEDSLVARTARIATA